MSLTLTHQLLFLGKYQKHHFHFNESKPISRKRCEGIRCCSSRSRRAMERFREEMSNWKYYELLGVPAGSSLQEIKEAYRKLQKKHHPDIAGQEGHEYTLMLNEAYKALIKGNLRKDHDNRARAPFGRHKSNTSSYSSWNGPLRPQALFVDENACIGCRECVCHAGKTFVMDEDLGCARVKLQFGDDQQKLEVSVDSCPVNCIYWVDSEELEVLEFLIRPQQMAGYGVFGGGWERPANVFSAAKSFIKQLKLEAAANNASVSSEEETPAQAEARAQASKEINMERFSEIWRLLEVLGLKMQNKE
ncbi:chaperone protein dnaJ C76, chloroplastic-like isoform X2 [Punica granatum]|uniref:Chaperone protein dnaJ C76, chloroplastic-like isoform X2 n=2 Tax=Punica granatum TaxID=22663 RepID=A0A6P8E4R2_PUNGR|nr:chaperone protein dnaJ C76, chloroplastic-like isoform X2 [Punica granatum]PKI55184.1 hypothetical protein CRG98_024475 [Punica granatum]